MGKRLPLLAILAIAPAFAGQAVASTALELTGAPGSSDTLFCAAMQGGKFKETRYGQDLADNKHWLMFASDAQSDTSEDYPNGFIDLGLAGAYRRLKSDPGATLVFGGSFSDNADPQTVLHITPLKVNFLLNAHAESESIIGLQARFDLRHGADSRQFIGHVRCSVYDFESFHDNICTAPRQRASLVCKALQRSIGTGAKARRIGFSDAR